MVADIAVAGGQQVDAGAELAVVDSPVAYVTEQPVTYERRGPVGLADHQPARGAQRAVRRCGPACSTASGGSTPTTTPVLVLTGAGDKAFCAGGDLKEMAATALQVPPPDFLPQFGRNIDVAKPTIAAVNGVAYAGGFLLAQSATCAWPPTPPGSRSPRPRWAAARRGPRRCPG